MKKLLLSLFVFWGVVSPIFAAESDNRRSLSLFSQNGRRTRLLVLNSAAANEWALHLQDYRVELSQRLARRIRFIRESRQNLLRRPLRFTVTINHEERLIRIGVLERGVGPAASGPSEVGR